MLVFVSKNGEKGYLWRHYDVTDQNNVVLELAKCFNFVFGHSFLEIEGKIPTKSVIKGVKLAQMLVFGWKTVKRVIYDVIMTSLVKMTSFWNLENAFVVSLGIVPWG